MKDSVVAGDVWNAEFNLQGRQKIRVDRTDELVGDPQHICDILKSPAVGFALVA